MRSCRHSFRCIRLRRLRSNHCRYRHSRYRRFCIVVINNYIRHRRHSHLRHRHLRHRRHHRRFRRCGLTATNKPCDVNVRHTSFTL